MLKEMRKEFTPIGASVNHIAAEENRAYAEGAKGFIHALFIPFILSFIHPLVATAYFITALILYSTIFRDRAGGFWFFSLPILAVIMLFLIPVFFYK